MKTFVITGLTSLQELVVECIFVFDAVSVVMKGEQMVPVLNSLDVKCAVYGNHEFGMFAAFTGTVGL